MCKMMQYKMYMFKVKAGLKSKVHCNSVNPLVCFSLTCDYTEMSWLYISQYLVEPPYAAITASEEILSQLYTSRSCDLSIHFTYHLSNTGSLRAWCLFQWNLRHKAKDTLDTVPTYAGYSCTHSHIHSHTMVNTVYNASFGLNGGWVILRPTCSPV